MQRWPKARATTLMIGLAAIGCARPTDAFREKVRPLLAAGRSLAKGVTRADSLRLGTNNLRWLLPAGAGTVLHLGSRSAATLAQSRPLDPSALCGVDASTLPRGIQLLPTAAESTFLRSPYQTPVMDAQQAQPPEPACGPAISVSPLSPPLNTSAYPDPPTRVQMQPVEVRFDSAVATASVYGVGAFKCYTGQYGRLTAYDEAGHVVSAVEMQMREPEDCSSDSITYGAYGTVSGAAPQIRRLVIEQPQPWSWEVWIEGTDYGLGYVTADYMLVLSPETLAASVEIVSAGGPNGGSFIVRAPENVIRLQARVTPASLAPNVEWEVLPLNNLVNSIPPDAVARGASSSFVVPASNINPGRGHFVPGRNVNPGRWPVNHPGSLSRKSLAYLITAKITVGGQTFRSKPDTVRQDEKDTIREEYVEFGQDSVVQRSELGLSGDASRNSTGDYTIWASGPKLLKKMPVIDSLARRRWSRGITVTSGYRNPVHHFVHAHAKAMNSPHLSGLATDWRITDGPGTLTDSLWFEEIHTLSKSRAVDGCWEPAWMIILTSSDDPSQRRLDHGHTDWREPCPTSW